MKSFASPYRRFIHRALFVLSFFGIAEMGWSLKVLSLMVVMMVGVSAMGV